VHGLRREDRPCHANEPPAVSGVASVTFLAAGAQALGDDQKSRSASTTGIDAHLTNTTPPDEVGQDVVIKLDGKITTPHHKPVSSCRVARQFHMTYPAAGGGHGGGDTYPTNRRGHFSAEFLLSYGTDVSEAGGTFTLTISTKRSHVPGKRLGESYTCKRLKETLQVDYAPALSG
jgi:hypothetical protein